MISSRAKKQLRDKINRLSFTEHEEIFKILKNNRCNFTQNKNGTFFDISNIDHEVLKTVQQFVEFCICNKTELDEYDKKIKECKINNSFDRLQSSTPLNDVITAEEPVEDWQALLTDVKSNEKINAFVNLLENNSERLSIKKTNTKFMNVKKKYSKKFTTEKKGESDLQNVLFAEPI